MDKMNCKALRCMNFHLVCFCPQDGGELYFSDVYSNERLPEDIKKHKVLWGVL